MRFLAFIATYCLILICPSNARADNQQKSYQKGLDFVSVKTKILCNDREKILQKLASDKKNKTLSEQESVYIERRAKGGYQFVLLDKEAQTLTACLNGKSFAAKLNGLTGDELELNSELNDFNKDGQVDFLLWNPSCGEGACFGKRALISIENDKFKISDYLDATLVNVAKKKSDFVFVRTHYCFSYEMEIVFEHRTFAELSKGGKFKTINLTDAKRRFPDIVNEALKASDTENTSNSSVSPEKKKVVDALNKISRLIRRAYEGESIKLLKQEFEKIEAPFGENKLPIYCDVPQILSDIQGTSTQPGEK